MDAKILKGKVTDIFIFSSKTASDNFIKHCENEDLKKLKTMCKNKTVKRISIK
mgnify:CR=1 FL=1